MAVKNPVVEQLVRAMRLKGHLVFESDSGFELNIVGVRSRSRRPDSFDDLVVVFHRRRGAWCVNYFPATTDPGLFWLQNPMVEQGCGILKPGQYRDAYQIGAHKGSYDALVQRGPVTVVRDFNRDAELDLDSGREESGLFGANIHRAGTVREATRVNKWSALCQVLANHNDFDILMALAKAGAAAWGNSFTYTLLDESDIYGVMA